MAFFLIIGRYNVAFFFPLVKNFPLEEGNETFKTSRYYTFKASLMSCFPAYIT